MSTALMLGGGGPVGMAWELGLLSGVMRSGVDLASLDLVVGTSAGSAVGAWLRRRDVTAEEFFERLKAANAELGGLMGKLMAADPQAARGPAALLDAMNKAAEAGGDAVTSNQAIGELAVRAPTISESAHVALFERLVGLEWPSAFLCEGIDVDSGELQTWDQGSDVSLGRAVAASCAWPGAFPAVAIAGRRFMDGGLWDGMNPQLAAGHNTVICVSCDPLASAEGSPAASARRVQNLKAGLEDLGKNGAQVVVVEPDSRFLSVSEHGAAMMDISRVPAAHTAGIELGEEVAERFASGAAGG